MAYTGYPGDWDRHAACKDTPAALFFPERGDDTEPAKQVCAGCTVRVECLQYALDNHIMHGVFGGTSEKQRKKMRGVYVRGKAA
jgi:WhiB family redox-sensing transcriptional regulator